MDPFTTNGRFCFPDQIFPAVPERSQGGVPPLPTATVADLEAQFQDIIAQGESYPVDRLITWVQTLLNIANLYGLGSPRAIEHAKHVLDVLSPSASPYAGFASYLLGFYYQAGILGFQVDKMKSRALLRRAIKLHYARAWYRIATNAETRGDHAKALSRYKQGAALDDAACLYRLAIAHLLGQMEQNRDVAAAMSLLDRAARRADVDYPQPAFLLGKLCLGEADLIPGLETVPPAYVDRARGFDLLRKAALFDFSPALMRLADAYQGEVEFDSAVTLRYLHLCARQERYLAYMERPSVLHGAPETLLVKWFLCGFQGVFAPNEKWAYAFAEVAAKLGSGTALFAMGYFYEVGITVPVDWEAAQRLYKRAAAAGCDAAKARLEKDLPTREPSLRRKLTRVDHERTLSKYRARLGSTQQNGPSMMVVDSLDAVPSPERSPEPGQPALKDSPTLAAPVPRSPPKLPYPDDAPRRRSFFGAAKDMLSGLPYPKSRSPSPVKRGTSPSRSPPRSPSRSPAYPVSNPPSPTKIASEPSLPYPEDAPPKPETPYPDSPPPPPAPAPVPVLPPGPAAFTAPRVPSPTASVRTSRIPSRHEPVRRKPVARAASGPVPSSPHHPTHARSQTISLDGANDLRELTPSPRRMSPQSLRDSNTPSPTRLPPPAPSSALTGPPIRGHRKVESVAVVSSSPSHKPERRLASSPVARRPGVAYTFEEMGVPVIAGDDSGKCIIS